MASSVDANRAIRNAPFRASGVILDITTWLPLTGGLTGITGKISKDQGAFASTTNTPVEIGTTGYLYCDLTATEMTADTILLEFQATNANKKYFIQQLCPELALDSGVAQAGAAGTITLRAGAVATDDYYNGSTMAIIRGTGAGQRLAISDYVGSTKVASVDRNWATNPDATSVYLVTPDQGSVLTSAIKVAADATAINGSTTAATNAATFWGAVVTSSVSDGSPAVTDFDGAVGLSATDNFYRDMVLVFTSGTLSGIPNRISGYTGSTRNFQFSSNWVTAPANADTFEILGRQK